MNLLLMILMGVTSATTLDDSTKLTVKTVYGEAVTQIVMEKTDGQWTIALTSLRTNKKSILNAEDARFILREYDHLPVPSSVPDSCYRARVDILLTQGGKSSAKASCVGVKTITSPRYARFLRILDTAL
jgi:hypothetical protein